MFRSLITLIAAVYTISAPADSVATKARSSIDRAMKTGASTEYQKLCIPAEEKFREIESTLLVSWRQAWADRHLEKFEKLLEGKSTKITSALPGPTARRAFEGISEFNWSRREGTTLAEYFAPFQTIADVSLQAEGAYPLVKDFSKIAGTQTEIASSAAEKLTLRFEVRGTLADGRRRHDRGTMEALVVKKNGEWKIRELAFTGGETLTASRPPAFSSQTGASGLSKVAIHARTEAIRRGGYALSINDFDRSGHASVFVGARGPATLWKGDGKGTFSQVKDFAPADLTLVKSAVFADFTNSGRSDLLVTRFTPEKRQADIGLFKNEGGGKFSERSDFIRNRWPANYSMPLAVADFNQDGLLDFYVGFPGRMDFTVFGKNNLIPAGQAVQGLFINKKDLAFEDVTKSAGLDTWTNTRTDLFPHSSIALDFNQDGRQDLVVIDDRGNLGPVYENTGDAKFAEVARKVGLGMNALGMGAAAGSIGGDGTLDIAMSYVNFSAATRIARSCKLSSMEAFGGSGVRLFKGDGKGQFKDITASAGLDWAGEGVAGIEFIDYNNDGFQDLYVTNGLWSGTSRDLDLGSSFAMAIALSANENAINALPEPGQPSFWQNYLSHFRDKRGQRPSMAGYQRNRLFRNNGDMTFTEVGYLEGIDSSADGYAAVRVDANEDGRMDLILRNADPGTSDFTFSPVEYYRNDFQGAGHSLKVKIANDDAVENRDGYGTSVTVETGERKQLQTLIANDGPVQGERSLHFGLGKSIRADKVEVRFADGTIQSYKNVPKGELTVLRKPRKSLGMSGSSSATKIRQ